MQLVTMKDRTDDVPTWLTSFITSLQNLAGDLKSLNELTQKVRKLEEVINALENDKDRIEEEVGVLKMQVESLEDRDQNIINMLAYGMTEEDRENVDLLWFNDLNTDIILTDIQHNIYVSPIKKSSRITRLSKQTPRPLIMKYNDFEKEHII